MVPVYVYLKWLQWWQFMLCMHNIYYCTAFIHIHRCILRQMHNRPLLAFLMQRRHSMNNSSGLQRVSLSGFTFTERPLTLLMVLLTLENSHKLSVCKVLPNWQWFYLLKGILKSVDENYGILKQFVPFEILGVIQIMYIAMWTKMWNANKYHNTTRAYLFFISLSLNVRTANKPNEPKMCAENMISHQINQALLWETEYLKAYILSLSCF